MPMVEPLSPWADGPEHDSPLDRRLSRAFGAIPEPGGLPDIARQRVAVRLRSRRRASSGRVLARLVAMGVVIGIASAAGAQYAAQHWLLVQQTVVVQPRPAPVVPLVPQPSLPRAPRAAASEPETAVIERRPSAAAFSAPPPVQSSPLGREAASLEGTLTALRAGGAVRAGQALAQLDRHLREFPHGSLELEARVARVDALLLLGRRSDAGRELSTLPIERVGRKHELRLIRAELRADEDCQAALADFQVLVDQSLPGPWAERALFGRGACLLRLGDKAGAERDFGRYLERFPDGRFAAQIRAQR